MLSNATIAERLDAFAVLLELAGAQSYTARAYRRAADMIRETPAPIVELMREGRVRDLRGSAPGSNGASRSWSRPERSTSCPSWSARCAPS